MQGSYFFVPTSCICQKIVVPLHRILKTHHYEKDLYYPFRRFRMRFLCRL